MTAQQPDGAESIRGMYRDRIVVYLAVASTVIFLPFAVNNWLQGRIVLGVGCTLIVLMLMVDALALWRKKPAPIPLPLLFIPMALSIVLTVRVLGLIGMLWAYPSILLFFFLMSRRVANAFAIAVLVLVLPFAVEKAGVGATIRFVVTLGMVIVFSNIFLSIIDTLHRRLAEQAVRDPLTGAYNRRHMEHLVSAIVSASESPVASLLIIDVDHFKHINDRLGHAAGDQVLREVAGQVVDHRPSGDVFRIGGEEFAMLLQGVRAAEAVTVAEGLRAGIEQAGTVTVSIGVAELVMGDAADDWFKRADDALYEAKRTGRNRVIRAAA